LSAPNFNILEWIQEAQQPFYLVFHPLISLSSGHTMGYEVLTRPFNEQQQPINAETFFQEVSRQGLSVTVDRIILRTIIQFVHTHDIPIPLFVNIHPDSLSDSIVQDLIQSCPDGSIVLEITERGNWLGASVENGIENFRHHGVAIALDDFGTGYSGLEKLVAIHPNYVKLDRTLITQCQMYPVKRNLMASVIQMARFLGFQLIAEGIETRDELLTCIDLGIEIGQGFYFGKPVIWQHTAHLPGEVIAIIRQRQREIVEVSSLSLRELDPFLSHWSLMLEHLADAHLSTAEQLATMMGAAFKMLQPMAMTVFQALPGGMQPLFSIGHARRDVISWETPALIIRAFRDQTPLILQQKSDEPDYLQAPVVRALGFPESVAVVPVGKPVWGTLSAYYMDSYKWSNTRIQILQSLAHLMTLLIPPPGA
jgi:EAL domain-containing protein (putative c-di-GMP-specific phosphodiesterase class I)